MNLLRNLYPLPPIPLKTASDLEKLAFDESVALTYVYRGSVIGCRKQCVPHLLHCQPVP
ncbi:hypothetical protein PILCRDRAFT_810565 [Piloderma croceum F 1598]|uniref:Uncharacterized protein n=1 Tax=Piloderma croceum (strain F 1598) TaxID=765440 RepID=A0A0C3GI34_PILCF|nr:hypothetical protein PILCRDRAFT_810565 [Piloderma croceum F 1598]